MKGKLITFEGGEGCGKSTVVASVLEHFENKGLQVKLFREPGGMSLSEDIRRIILSSEMDPVTEALLFAAARAELMKKTIIPLLENGTIVILDRYVMSSLCYQGYCGIGVDKVLKINTPALYGYMPDLVVLLDLDPEIGLSRIKNAQREVNRIDEKPLSYHHKVREGYLYLSKHFENIFAVVDASLDVKKVVNSSISEIEKII